MAKIRLKFKSNQKIAQIKHLNKITATQIKHAWQKAIKLRYWLHFGLKDDSGYFVDWKDTKTKAGDTTQHLISISSISENGDVVEKVKLFTLNIIILHNEKENYGSRNAQRSLVEKRI